MSFPNLPDISELPWPYLQLGRFCLLAPTMCDMAIWLLLIMQSNHDRRKVEKEIKGICRYLKFEQ